MYCASIGPTGPTGPTGPSGPTSGGSYGTRVVPLYSGALANVSLTPSSIPPAIGQVIGIPITTFADVFLSSAQPPPTLTLGTAHSPDVVSPDTLSQVVLLPRTTTVASLYGQLASSVVITTDAPVVMQASIYANAPTSPGTFSLQGTYGFDPLPSPIAVGSTVSLAISSLSLGPYPAGTSLLALLTVQPSGSLSFTGGAFYLSMSYGMV